MGTARRRIRRSRAADERRNAQTQVERLESRTLLSGNVLSLGYGGNGHHYGVVYEKTTWTAAEADAVARGGHLATITSAGEQDFITQTFLVGPGEQDVLWIGLTDRDSPGDFRWVTGEQSTFSNWNPDEPNAYDPVKLGPEDYVAINWHTIHRQSGPPADGTLGDWNDLPDVGYNGAVQELWLGALNVHPEPNYALIEFDELPTDFPGTLFRWHDAPVPADWLVGVDLQAPSNLLRVDPATGAAHAVASTDLHLRDIAAAADGSLFGVTDTHLVRLDPDTLGSQVVGDGTGFSGLNALAAAPDGTLYAATAGGELLALDPVTGDGTSRGSYGQWVRSAGDIAVTDDGTLFASTNAGTHDDMLMRIDPTTGVGTEVGSIGFGEVYGLTFGGDGVLYASTESDRRNTPMLIRIDVATGAGAEVGAMGTAGGVAGLAPARSVPPGSVAGADPVPPDTRPPVSGNPVLTADEVIVTEPAGDRPASAVFTVTLSEPAALTVTVNYGTNAGTATAGEDYTSVSGSLTFAVGETWKTVTVPILADDRNEYDERFELVLKDALHASAGFTGWGEATIRDAGASEPPPPTPPPPSTTPPADDDAASPPMTLNVEEHPTGHGGGSFAVHDAGGGGAPLEATLRVRNAHRRLWMSVGVYHSSRADAVLADVPSSNGLSGSGKLLMGGGEAAYRATFAEAGESAVVSMRVDTPQAVAANLARVLLAAYGSDPASTSGFAALLSDVAGVHSASARLAQVPSTDKARLKLVKQVTKDLLKVVRSKTQADVVVAALADQGVTTTRKAVRQLLSTAQARQLAQDLGQLAYDLQPSGTIETRFVAT